MNSNEITSNLSFRLSEAVDLPAIVQLVNSAYRGESSRRGWTTEAEFLEGQRTDLEMLQEFLEKPNQWMAVGILDGKIVSTVQLEKRSGNICYFGMFTVKPEIQNLGIGKIFLRWVERFAKENLGCEEIEMTVITLRKELIPWYERQGYQYSGENRSFPYGNERFGKPLRKDLVLGVWGKRL